LPFFNRFIQVLMRLALGIFAAVALLSLLALGLVMLLLALLRALVTGKKPAAVTAFSRFRQFSGQQMAGRWRSTAPDNFDTISTNARDHKSGQPARSLLGSDEVVDVEVREIPAERPPR
jgi:type IV secretory pathway TrbL component